jgi:hypothetical protein
MFIIWGFRNAVTTLATVFATCRACGNPAAQRLSLVKRRFTLFFIPVFTMKKTYVQTCAMCGTHRKLDEAEALQLQAGAAAAQQHEAMSSPASPASPAPMAPPAPMGAPAPADAGAQISVTKNDKFVL